MIFAVFPSVFAPYDPDAFDYGALLQAPAWGHPFGTDNYGRDILSRVIHGYSVDMQIAIFATIRTLVFGTVIGAVVGYVGGLAESIFSSIVDVVITFPFLVLVIAIVSVLGPGLINMYIAVGIVNWVFYARLIASEIKVQSQLDYASAARVMGYHPIRIIFRHLLPNVATSVLVYWMTDMALAILLGSKSRLSRSWRTAADGRMGRPGIRRQELHYDSLVDSSVPGHLHRDHGSWLQPCRRWPRRTLENETMNALPETGEMLSIRGLSVTFETSNGKAQAVDGIDLDVGPGEILGLVGESGSGKSLTLRSILQILPAAARMSGAIKWRGSDLAAMDDAQMRRVRGADIAMIFQEPMTALNPVLPIRLQIEESLAAHTMLNNRERRARALELMDLVGIASAERRLDEYPHQFSGGMRQRVMIAIALACKPKLLLADEPTTALDVTVQDQILRLILHLRDQLSMSVLFVTHDLGVVAETCDRMAVMYAGRIVETGSVRDVLAAPMHPYTRGLLASVPQAGGQGSRLQSIEGTPPPLFALPAGCAFGPRCSAATQDCETIRPGLELVGGNRSVACLNHTRIEPQQGQEQAS